ncbi:MAG: DnaJ domain-containing protein [Xanthobacter sp.]
MAALLAGVLLLLIGLYGIAIWTRTDPKVLIQTAARTFAVLALIGAVGALVLGRVGLAIPLGMVGFGLLGRYGPAGLRGMLGGAGGGGKAPRKSQVSTPMLEMELDHASGAMRGRVLNGPYGGQELDALAVPDLLALRATCDAQSLALLEAYLDRRAPAWREHAQGDPGGGNMGRPPGSSGAMTEEEAYEALGLEPGADAARIREAHRRLMKEVHPDHGGSTADAARINQAKDMLLRKHV